MADFQQSDESNEAHVNAIFDREAHRKFWKGLPKFFSRNRPVFWKTIGFLGGIVIPVFCFLMSAGNGLPGLMSKWQSGQPNQYADLMLQAPGVLPFYPILLYCIVCCGLVLFGGQRWINRFGVRFGIYTGVPISIQFHLLVFAPTQWNIWYFAGSVLSLLAGVFAVLVALAIVLLVGAVLGKVRRKIGWRLSIAILLLLYTLRCMAILLNEPRFVLQALFPVELIGLVLIGLVLGTTLSTVTYGLLSWHVWRTAEDRRFRFGILQMLGGLTWSAAFLAAWRSSVSTVLAEYAKLPVNKPTNCYVCTAAARGHKRFVGSFEIEMPDGARMIVNRQLQLLKAAELTVMVTFPVVHRRFRWLYDRIGPPVASCLVTRWFADVAFLSLLLIEWPAKCLLRIAGITDRQIRTIYRSSDSI